MPKPPTQPSPQDEHTLLDIADGSDTGHITIRGRRLSIPDLNRWGLHKISRIIATPGGDELTISCKCLAAARLNGYFKIRLLWWALWRWYAFIRAYTDLELAPAFDLIKKKAEIALAAFSLNTTLLIAIRETTMRMNRQEAKTILQELSGENPGKSAKNAPG